MDLVDLTLVSVTLAVIAGALGFNGISSATARFYRLMFVVFITLSVVLGVMAIKSIS